MNEFLPRAPTHGQQKRSGKRAPHGSPLFPRRIGGWATEEQYQLFHRKGGSIWLRSVLDYFIEKERLDALPSPTSKDHK